VTAFLDSGGPPAADSTAGNVLGLDIELSDRRENATFVAALMLIFASPCKSRCVSCAVEWFVQNSDLFGVVVAFSRHSLTNR
jgi:hypothetical protein